MNLLTLIEKNSNYKEILSEKGVWVTEIEGLNGENFIMFKYDKTSFCKFREEYLFECRGSIIDIDNMKFVCRPFDKFFNFHELEKYTEGTAYEFDFNKDLWISEKLDGSLIKVWKYNGLIHISTNGMFDSKLATYKTTSNEGLEEYNTFYDLFMMTNPDLSSIKEGYTYMYELTTPDNIIVVEHKEYVSTLLSIRNNLTGEEEIHTDKLKLTVSDILAIIETLGIESEGYVVFDGKNRFKLKGLQYVLAHYGVTNAKLSTIKLFDKFVVEADEVELIVPKTLQETITKMRENVERYIDNVRNEFKLYSSLPTQKEFALAIVDLPIKRYLFTLKAGKPLKIEGKDYIFLSEIYR